MEAPVGKRREDMVAVVGAESSTNTKQLAELLGLFAIPQVCYYLIYLQYVSSVVRVLGIIHNDIDQL